MQSDSVFQPERVNAVFCKS